MNTQQLETPVRTVKSSSTLQQHSKLTIGKKRSGKWAKRRKEEDRKSDRTRQKNKRGGIEKWDQTDSPEIPDRGET